MSARPTPETNRLNADPLVEAPDIEWIELATKLERQRDEAVKFLREWLADRDKFAGAHRGDFGEDVRAFLARLEKEKSE